MSSARSALILFSQAVLSSLLLLARWLLLLSVLFALPLFRQLVVPVRWDIGVSFVAAVVTIGIAATIMIFATLTSRSTNVISAVFTACPFCDYS